MLLQDLYNKVLGFFRQTDAEQQQESSKETACNRLRVVLMQDRTNLTPELLERMRGELVELLSKYLEMDKEALELNLEQDGEQVALMLSIPVIRAKDEEEIKEALAKEDEKKAREEDEALEGESEDETKEESEDESEDETSEDPKVESEETDDEIEDESEQIEEVKEEKKNSKK